MRRVFKTLRAILVIFLAALGVLAVVISHDSQCETGAEISADTQSMQAYAYRCYGASSVLELEDSAKPVPSDDQVLIEVRAASVNPLDWHTMRGSPYLMRLGIGIGKPTDPRLGVDFAGIVEAVGKDVHNFKPGDEVFGGADGAFAQYVTVRASRALALKPANLTFEQAATLPIAASTALQALRDSGRIRAGEKILINGASGGVGTFAVQIAKSFGAEVTGVCSTRNLEMVRSLGADHVIDYTRQDFTEDGKRYDLIVDMVGNHSPFKLRHALEPDGRLVTVGGGNGSWVGPFSGAISSIVLSPFVQQEMGMMLARLEPLDLVVLRNLVEAGKLTPVIDRSYPFEQVPAAIDYLEEGHARGKIVISMDQPAPPKPPSS